MSFVVPEFSPHTDAMLALLAGVGVPVADQDAADLTPPYLVLDRGPSPTTGPIDEPYADAFISYQVTCVGDSRRASEDLADAARAVVLAGLTVAGRSIPRIQHTGSMAANSYVSGGVQWFAAYEEFRVWSTP